jgi:hypothetical protein
VDVYHHAFLTTALDGDEWSASLAGRFISKGRDPGTHWIGAVWAPDSVWRRWWRGKFSAPAGTRTPDHPAHSSTLCHWAIPAPYACYMPRPKLCSVIYVQKNNKESLESAPPPPNLASCMPSLCHLHVTLIKQNVQTLLLFSTTFDSYLDPDLLQLQAKPLTFWHSAHSQKWNFFVNKGNAIQRLDLFSFLPSLPSQRNETENSLGSRG